MRYDAFISYRHSDFDLMIAKKLHKGLETFRVPKAVAKKSGKKNIKRVFRDQEELPIGSDLGDNITAALTESEFLIVVCSPRTPESYWVQKEIETFIKLHGREKVLAVLIEGEPHQSFPKQLLEDEKGNPIEPLAADLRGNTKKEINRKLRTEIMRLAAPVLACSYDDLRQRHRERKLRKTAGACGAAAVFALLFGAYSTYNAVMIQQNYEEKQRNQSKYLADTALRILEEGDRRSAVLLALEALPSKENRRPYVAQAQYALSRALRCYDMGNRIGMDRVLQHGQPVRDFWLNSQGTKAISVDQGEQVYVWNVENGEKIMQIKPRVGSRGTVRVNKMILCGENVVVCDEETLRSLSFDGQENWCVESPERIIHCEFNEETMTAACVNGSRVAFYDMTSGEELGSMENKQENSFTMEAAFHPSGTKFGVAHISADQKEGCVSVYDFRTKTGTVYPTAENYICEMKFTSDNQLVVAECDGDSLLNFDYSTAVGCLEKIDLQSKETLWKQEYEYKAAGTLSTSTHILCRKYMDAETGKELDEILMSEGNTAYVWDNEDGTLLTKMETDGGIAQLRAALSSGFGYLAQSNGTIHIADMTKGIKYTDNSIQTNKELRDISIRGGVLMMRAYASPELTVMKYHEGAGMEMLESYEGYIKKVDDSENESYYAVNGYGGADEDRILFYRTEDNSPVGEWEIDTYVQDSSFVNDTCYVLLEPDGEIQFYDAKSGQSDMLSTGEWSASVKGSISKSSAFALIYDGSKYCVVNLQNKDIICQGEIDAYMEYGMVSDDGNYIYCSIQDAGMEIIETETRKTVEIGSLGYRLPYGSVKESAITVSEDGHLLAVCCQDGMLRVLDLERTETVAEIPFTGTNRRFIEFDQDNHCLLMQGDDYYLKVYNLKQQELVFIAEEQYYEIKEAVIDRNTNTVSLITDVNLIIVSREGYDCVAQIEGGIAYFPKYGRILCTEFGQMYRFPYMDLEMLREEKEKQFGEETLSPQETIKFHAQ